MTVADDFIEMNRQLTRPGIERLMTDCPETLPLNEAREVLAPDGSKVRPLCLITGAGSFAHFSLGPGEVAKAVSHATVQEIWYIIGGTGQMYRRYDDVGDTIELRPGVCLTIPIGTIFQFRATTATEPLQAIAVTMPPWPIDGEPEARPERGPWTPTTGG